MALLFVLALFCGSDNETSLDDLISIEKLENGTDEERVREIDKALKLLTVYRFTPTPDEFRIVALGLRDENSIIRAGSAALLEKLSSQSAKIVAKELVRKRYDQFRTENDDEKWFKAVYYLGYRSEIPGVDAFQAFHKHFKPHRNCGSDYYAGYRPDFDFSSHIKTKDLTTLNYAIGRQIESLGKSAQTSLAKRDSDRVTNIAEHCPNQTTKELAKKLLKIANKEKGDR